MTERRRYLRFNTPLELEYRTLTLNPIFGKALAKDLSKEGLRFELKQSLPPGTAVEISLNVPGDNLPVFATGKIAWADGLDAGVRLTKISHEDRARLLEHAYREWLKSFKRIREGTLS
ncbi:MAG: PilZ domain-containing protein [Candidatus Omnitrophica bacterium]|nr:PilZ domain-containing protein [Candidatus Omnitrophota bacterium]